MERRSERISSGTRSGTVVDARTSLALWLRAGRAQRGISLEEVSRITKIQVRILERLEAGKGEGLPADVFVRGFVRSFAKCVGLDEEEALRRYHACANPAAVSPVSAHSAAHVTARAVVDAMADLAPATASSSRPRSPTAEIMAAGSMPGLPIPDFDPAPLASMTMLPATGTLVETAAATMPVETASVEEITVAPEAETAPVVEAPIVVAPALADDVVEPSAPPEKTEKTAAESGKSKKRGKRNRRAKRTTSRADMAVGTPAQPSPIVQSRGEDAQTSTEPPVEDTTAIADAAPDEQASIEAAPSRPSVVEISELPPIALDVPDGLAALDAAPLEETVVPDVAIEDPTFEEPIATTTWQPRMPTVAPSVPWRRPGYVTPTAAPVPSVPSLVIDDADPEGADQIREERAARSQPRRSFLPPILLDREDRSARQGGLTLAVIILLIAATLTLSYLMRRPSSSGDGVTAIPASIDHIG